MLRSRSSALFASPTAPDWSGLIGRPDPSALPDGSVFPVAGPGITCGPKPSVLGGAGTTEGTGEPRITPGLGVGGSGICGTCLGAVTEHRHPGSRARPPWAPTAL